MTKLYKLIILCAFVFTGKSFSQICNASGNLVIYSNYDGGIITVNCDVNIPNLKIGICTYEAAEIHIIGTFSNNVTGVIYAGYDGSNDNCNLGVITTTILNVSASVATINVYPSVGPYTPVHGNGNPNTVGCYNCDTTVNAGGANTPDEVVFYFLNAFPASTLRSHHTQYNCWTPTTFNLSAGGNCCIMPASFSPCVPPTTPTNVTIAANQNVCAGVAATLAVNSSTTVNWFATSTSTSVIGIGTSFISPTLSAGNYTYYAAAVNSCSISVKVPISVTVNLLPNLTISATSSVCAGQVTTISVSGANTYSWSTSQTTSVISISPSVTTVYTVTGTSVSNCKNTATVSVNVFTCTALSQLSGSTLEFKIFPNPAKISLNLTSSVGKKKIEITDITGKLVHIEVTEDTNKVIDLKDLSAGIYVFTIEKNGLKQNVKLVVE
ncbi:MAG: T9SS type A sorting domain-containing protein [Bacteroidota bacterium]|nr:T9SS type A sorting domain-containing protein [Bacteroidota bacterium]